MKYPKDFGYMSIIETIADVNNTFLSRRELTCNFTGLGGKLKKLEAVEMITKKFKLNDKVVIPMGLKNHVGKPLITGIFYVYDDEALAKRQINPTIFSRLEKTKAKLAEAETTTEDAPAKEVKEDAPAKEVKEDAPAKEVKEDAPAKEVKEDAPAKESKNVEKTE